MCPKPRDWLRMPAVWVRRRPAVKCSHCRRRQASAALSIGRRLSRNPRPGPIWQRSSQSSTSPHLAASRRSFAIIPPTLAITADTHRHPLDRLY
ncbi:hypothetical protein CI102_11609 [Trichoderma harzianum]|nr:hypothetical protein CI102_11609 [Trichoderma harzianum]